MNDTAIPGYRELVADLSAQLAERGSLGMLLVDASALTAVEYSYGSQAFEEVRRRLFAALLEGRGKDYRGDDVLALEEPHGLRFFLVSGPKRRRHSPLATADLKAFHARISASLLPNLGRAGFPYVRTSPRLDVGWAMALHNPLIRAERILQRALEEAGTVAAHQRQADQLSTLERLQDIILAGRINTAYQPILDMKTRVVLGFEALSRPPRGSGLDSADALFGAAEAHRLLVELDRLCRQRALLNSGRIPTNARLFVNTLPATIRDPQFRGRPLIDFLARAQVAPDRIVIEITEKLVIENYGLFREAMAYFTDLGMQFAVDDVGAGYSGLESIARLKPTYLKIDTALVRDVHVSLVNREMVKAIISLGQGIGATIIAEGIHTEQELATLREMGVQYGQGFYLARPDPGPDLV